MRARRGDGPGRRLPALRAPAWPSSSGSPAACSTTPPACCSRSRATRVDAFLARLPAEAPPLARVERCAPSRSRRLGEGGLRHPRVAARRARRTRAITPDAATCEDCLRRAVRPGRPPLPLPVRQLHELRPAVHDRPRRPVRPAADDDGRRSRCARPAGPSTTTRATAASTPSRTPARRAGRASGSSAREAAGDAVAAAARALLRRRDRRGQGPRRLPPRLPRRRRGARWRALRARKHREDQPFALMVRDVAAAARADRAGGRRAALAGAADRARAAPAGRARRRVGRAALARPRRDAAVLAAAPPAGSPTPACRW